MSLVCFIDSGSTYVYCILTIYWYYAVITTWMTHAKQWTIYIYIYIDMGWNKCVFVITCNNWLIRIERFMEWHLDVVSFYNLGLQNAYVSFIVVFGRPDHENNVQLPEWWEFSRVCVTWFTTPMHTSQCLRFADHFGTLKPQLTASTSMPPSQF